MLRRRATDLAFPPIRLAAAALLVLVAVGAEGCGRDHGLGVTGSSAASTSTTSGSTSSASSSGSGGTGMGGAPTTSTTGTSTASSASTTGTGGSGGQIEVDAGPTGPTKLTVLNGVTDYDAIRICFIPYPAGDPSAMPWPAAANGLAFAHAAVLDPIDAVIPTGTDVRPYLVTGDLTTTAGKSCAAIFALGSGGTGGAGGAGPSPILVTPLPVLPAPVFTSKKSMLFAPTGCLGGPGHDGPSATTACGFQYTPQAPTTGLVVLAMSRITDPAHVALQIVNASVALQPSDVSITPGFNGVVPVTVAPSLSTGALGPKPPFVGLKTGDYGPLAMVTINTSPAMQMFTSSKTPLDEAFVNGTVSKAEFVDGAGLVLVAVGGYPGAVPGPPWHKLTFTMIRADP